MPENIRYRAMWYISMEGDVYFFCTLYLFLVLRYTAARTTYMSTHKSTGDIYMLQ